MRSVRCDVCGTKALVAASTCPKCGHGFENRDGFGELLPLAHCTSCDSYYPHSVGSCRWCGTKPERSPIGPLGPYIWKGFGGLVLASLAIGAWLSKNETPSKPKPAPRTFVADTLPTNQPKAESFGRKISLARPDSATPGPVDSTVVVRPEATRDTAIALSTVDTLPAASTPVVAPHRVAIQSAGTVVQSDSVSSSVEAPPSPPPEPSTATPAEKPATHPATKAPKPAASVAPAPTRAHTVVPPMARTPTSKSSSRSIAKAPPPRATTTRAAPVPTKSTAGAKTRAGWVTSVARNWAVVRSNPTRQSRIIAAIGPNTRVQLGETRGDWRRIRAKGLSGWVEHRTLVATTYTPPRSRLAAR
jgi:hypothetical protein